MCGRRSKLGWRILGRAEFTLTRRSEKSSRCREHHLVVGGTQSLRSIKKFIAQDSEFYAARMVARLIKRVERAATAPGQGYPVHEYPEANLKEVHESPYRIIYAFTDDEFRVVTIVHFKQRFPKKG
jgi:plasmid stabilization system protein ParE